jgi:hypothetical protein
VSAGGDWLAHRVASAPPELLETMLAAVADDESAIPDALAAGALTLYEQVVHGTGGREDALPLLAADALFTHAFEAQAIMNPEQIREFTARWGAAGALARIELP